MTKVWHEVKIIYHHMKAINTTKIYKLFDYIKKAVSADPKQTCTIYSSQK